MPKSSSRQSGFVLAELLAVVAILGILTLIAWPSFAGATDSAKNTKLQANLRNGDNALAVYMAAKGQYPATLQQLVDGGVLAALPTDAQNQVLQYAVQRSGYLLWGFTSQNQPVYSPGSSQGGGGNDGIGNGN